MSTIGSNIAALKSLHNLRLNEDGFAKATERLSSGKRLNNAGDDAAGAAIVNRMSSQIAGMNVAIRNAGDAISMSQVAEGALHEVSEILQRMRELAVQAANGSYSGADRVSLNQEIVSLKKELIRIGETTTFNTTKLLNGTFQDTEFEISFDESPQHTHSLSIEDIRPNKIGMWNMSSQTEKVVEVSTVGDFSATPPTITTTADHDFKIGDIVTYENSGSADQQILGLESGRSYKVLTASGNTFTLQDLDGVNLAGYGKGTAAGGELGEGQGAKFYLNSLGNAPSVGLVGASDPVSSETLGAEELDIYGYVGKETAKFKNGASAREIANSVMAVESKTGVVASASTHARLTLNPDDSTDAFTVIAFDLYGNEIYPGVHYIDNRCYLPYNTKIDSCPNATILSDQLVTLPIHFAKCTKEFSDKFNGCYDNAAGYYHPYGDAKHGWIWVDSSYTGDFRLSILTHELGHALGLNHNFCRNSVMSYSKFSDDNIYFEHIDLMMLHAIHHPDLEGRKGVTLTSDYVDKFNLDRNKIEEYKDDIVSTCHKKPSEYDFLIDLQIGSNG